MTREFVNLSHQQQQQINALESTYASLPSTIIAVECANQDWRDSHMGLMQAGMEAWISFEMGIIASAKNNTNMA